MKINKTNHPDLTRTKSCEKSLSFKLEDIIKDIVKYDLIELKKRLVDVIDDPATSISKQKAALYKNDMLKIYSLQQMERFVTNIYLSGANLNLSNKRR